MRTRFFNIARGIVYGVKHKLQIINRALKLRIIILPNRTS